MNKWRKEGKKQENRLGIRIWSVDLATDIGGQTSESGTPSEPVPTG